MIPLGAYLKHKQPEQYRNWVTVLMQNGYPIPRWGEYGGVTLTKEQRAQVAEEEEQELTGFQRFIDRLMRRKPRPGK